MNLVWPKRKRAFKTKKFIKAMENQDSLLMFSHEGNISSTAVENSAFKCINQDTVYNTVNR